MPIVHIKEREPFEVALRKFKRSCEKAGVMAEMRRHEFYEKPTAAKKRRKAQALKRWQKKLFREKVATSRSSTEKVVKERRRRR